VNASIKSYRYTKLLAHRNFQWRFKYAKTYLFSYAAPELILSILFFGDMADGLQMLITCNTVCKIEAEDQDYDMLG
jgi:hypothetical protein